MRVKYLAQTQMLMGIILLLLNIVSTTTLDTHLFSNYLLPYACLVCIASGWIIVTGIVGVHVSYGGHGTLSLDRFYFFACIVSCLVALFCGALYVGRLVILGEAKDWRNMWYSITTCNETEDRSSERNCYCVLIFVTLFCLIVLELGAAIASAIFYCMDIGCKYVNDAVQDDIENEEHVNSLV